MINMDGGWVFVIAVVITGLVVVFLALVILILFVSMLGRFFVSIQNKKTGKKKESELKEPEKATLPVVQAETVLLEGDDDEVIAVISAAIAMMSLQDGKNYKIKSVRKSKSANKSGERPVWASAGLQQNTMPF